MKPTRDERLKFHDSGFFVLRTPLLPFCAFAAASNDGDDGEGMLKRLLADPDVLTALQIASPDLVKALDAEWAGPDRPERRRGLLHSVQRYVARMSGRATPFGLFAGISTGSFSDHSSLALPEREKWVRRSHIDMGFLAQVVERFVGRAEVRDRLRFRLNTSLYRIDDQWRYAESVLENSGRSYRLISMRDTPHLRAVLRDAQQGATKATLARRVAKALGGVTAKQVAEFVDELIDAQILVPDLPLPVTGADVTCRLIDALAPDPVTAPLSAALSTARRTLEESDQRQWGNLADPTEAVAGALRDFGAPPAASQVIQVDLFKPTAGLTLSKRVVAAIADGIRVLHRFGQAGAARAPQLDDFRKQFVRRYGENEVPLFEALDDDSGIGFPAGSGRAREESQLLAGLGIGRRGSDDQVPWSVQEALLSRKLGEALLQRAPEVQLSEQDLSEIPISTTPMPDSFSVLCSVAAKSAEAIDQGDFRVLIKAMIGPSGARYLGRFCYGEERLGRAVQEHVAAEEGMKPEAIFAEIVHLPRGRLGNFLRRPVLRRYEIPYLGDSAVPPQDQIPVDDLLVSVAGDRIVLRSRARGCEVLPRLSSAHHYNVDREMPIYRFLGALQVQGIASRLGFNWGPMKYSVPFLPRVVVGKCVLERQRWNLSAADLAAFEAAKSASEMRDAVERLRERKGFPRFLVVEEQDNALPIDLDQPLSAEAFGEMLKKRPKGPIMELLPGPDELCVGGQNGRFVHELFVPFLADHTAAPAAERKQPGRSASPRVRHRPGSEWLFVKLYTGEARADQLLREVVGPLLKWAKAERLVERWFFIRYLDPDHHIRLRFKGTTRDLYGPLRERLRRDLGRPRYKTAVWQELWDTYVPETERYGGAASLEISEELFQLDSELVLGLLRDTPADLRWMFAFAGIDRLLASLGMPIEERLACVELQRDRFFKEFALEASDRQRLGARYREHRPALMALLERPVTWPQPFRAKAGLFEWTGKRSSECGERLQALYRARRVSIPLRELAGSLIHLHVNRMLRSGQREHETVLYHFLAQSYRSALARREPLR